MTHIMNLLDFKPCTYDTVFPFPLFPSESFAVSLLIVAELFPRENDREIDCDERWLKTSAKAITLNSKSEPVR